MPDSAFNRPVVARTALLADGVSDPEIRTALRRGSIDRVRPGIYSAGPMDHGGYLDFVTSMASKFPEYVVSHESALAVWGAPTVFSDQRKVHLTRAGHSGGVRRAGLILHTARFDEDDLGEHNGIRITNAARALVETARSGDIRTVAAAGDWLLHRQLVDGRAIRECLDRCRTHRGISTAWRSLAKLDAKAESPGESATRIILDDPRLPTIESQLLVFDDSGRLVGRTDFCDRDAAVVVEFDGSVKYAGNFGDGRAQLWAEKAREDRLRACGLIVVRFVWADLADPDEMVRRVLRALEIGRRAVAAGSVSARFRSSGPAFALR